MQPFQHSTHLKTVFICTRMVNGIMPIAKSPVDMFVLVLFLQRVSNIFRKKFFDLRPSTVYIFHEISEDFCAENPCQNDGVCDNNIDGTGYECVCYGPYRGKNCEESIYEDYEGMSIFSLSVKN